MEAITEFGRDEIFVFDNDPNTGLYFNPQAQVQSLVMTRDGTWAEFSEHIDLNVNFTLSGKINRRVLEQLFPPEVGWATLISGA